MNNRFRHCSSKSEAELLLRQLLISSSSEEEKQAVKHDYDAYLEFEKRYEGESYCPMTMDDEEGYDYHENIDFKDISDDD